MVDMDVELVRDRVRRAATLLAGLEVSDLDADEVGAVLVETCAARSHVARLEMALSARASELHDAGRADDPVDLLTGVGAMPRREAQRVVRHADLLGRMPHLAAALKSGAVTDGHIDAVATGRRRIDAALRTALDAEDEAITRYAIRHSPDQLTERLAWIGRRLERSHTRDLDMRRRRAVRLTKRVDPDGMHQLHATFDPETGERIFGALDTAIEALRQHPERVVPGEDPRDPLCTDREFLGAHALYRLISHGHMATHPGLAEVVLIADERTITSGEHPNTICEYADGTPADPALARRLCCEAMFTAVVVTADGRTPLNAGRTTRVANREQRRALRAVYRTCAFEGCTVPFDWCEIHHIWFWELGGPTDVDNLVPLCLRHHHLIHDHGWKLTLNPVDRTLTVYRPDGTIYREARPPGLRPPGDDDPDPPLPAGPPDRSPCTTAA